jgi:plastocyanin
MDVPANVAFPLLFENRDGAPHNITILDAGGSPLFVGETFSGYGSRTYAVPPIGAGSYAFRCDVHTYMTGTLVAGVAVAR